MNLALAERALFWHLKSEQKQENNSNAFLASKVGIKYQWLIVILAVLMHANKK